MPKPQKVVVAIAKRTAIFLENLSVASTAIGLFQDSNLALIMGASTFVAAMILHGVLSE